MIKYFLGFLMFSALTFGADDLLSGSEDNYCDLVEKKPYIYVDTWVNGTPIFRKIKIDPKFMPKDVVDILISADDHIVLNVENRFVVRMRSKVEKCAMKVDEAYLFYAGNKQLYRPKLNASAPNHLIAPHERDRIELYQDYYTEVVNKEEWKKLGIEGIKPIPVNYLKSLFQKYLIDRNSLTAVERMILRKEVKSRHDFLFFKMDASEAWDALIDKKPGTYLIRKSSQPENKDDELFYLVVSYVYLENGIPTVTHIRTVHWTSYGYGALDSEGDLFFHGCLIDLLEELIDEHKLTTYHT